MARKPRIDVGEIAYHVINRANNRVGIFENSEDYADFEYLLQEIVETFSMRILAYVIMPNHWHLLLHPRKDGDLAKSMQWLGTTHSRRFHTKKKTIGQGHLYQGRYKSFPIQDDRHLLTVLKYIERNPARAKLCLRSEQWQWGSAYRRVNSSAIERNLLDTSLIELPANYLSWLNEPEPSEELKAIRHSIQKALPYY